MEIHIQHFLCHAGFEDTTEDVHIEFTVNCLDATFNFTLKAGSDKKYFQVDYNCRNASTRISVRH